MSLLEAVEARYVPRKIALEAAVAYFAPGRQVQAPEKILEYAEAFEAWLTEREKP